MMHFQIYHYLINIAIAYTICSIPFGLIFSKIFGNGDVRQMGSKNIGATNVWRTQGKLLGFATFFFDFFKGFLVCHIFSQQQSYDALLMFASVIGHIYPIWLNFKGGKGIATFLGSILAVSPISFAILSFAWLIVFYFSKISSLSAIIMLEIVPIITVAVIQNNRSRFIALASIILAVVMKYRHKENIKRLLNKEENTIK